MGEIAFENEISVIICQVVIFGLRVCTPLLFVFQLMLPQILCQRGIILPLSLNSSNFGQFNSGKPISSQPTRKCLSALASRVEETGQACGIEVIEGIGVTCSDVKIGICTVTALQCILLHYIAHWVLPEHVTQLPLKTFFKKS